MPAPAFLDLSDLKRAKILIASDTHGVLDPRIEALLMQCDGALHAGDIGGSLIVRSFEKVPSLLVRGNNDLAAKWEGSAEDLDHLPESALVALPGGSVAVEHGHRAGAPSRRHDRLRQRHPEARAIVYGHSHRALVDDASRPWVLNPGAAGRARTFGGPSFLWLHAGPRRWQVEAVRLPPA